MLQADMERRCDASGRRLFPFPSARAVFLDKDGTLVENVPFNVERNLIRLVSGAGPALKRVADAGYRVFVVSNQPGVARGLFTERQLRGAFDRINRLLRPAGAAVEEFYYCPHDPGYVNGACACRKPAEGLITRAASRHGIDLAQSWMVGDILNDVEAGRRAGCRTVLVDNGNETEWKKGPMRMPDAIAPDLASAVDEILLSDVRSPWS